MQSINPAPNSSYSIHFSVIRKECSITSLSLKQKYRQDTRFMKFLSATAASLKTTSLYLYWFPIKIQVLIEGLFKNSNGDKDLSGLLSLIMLAGISLDEDICFKDQIIGSFYLLTSTNEFYESNRIFWICYLVSHLMIYVQCHFYSSQFISDFFFCLQGTQFLESVRECCTNNEFLYYCSAFL
jgi:hypothetical protein